MHKLISRILIPLLSVWFVLQPSIATAGAISTYRVGSTYYPITASGAAGAALDVAMLAGRATPWIGGLTLGYQLGKLALEGLDSSNAVVPLNVYPAGVAQVPDSAAAWSGWTYNSTTKTWLPPSTSASTFNYYPQFYLAGGERSTPQSACDYYATLNAGFVAQSVVDLGIYTGTKHYFMCTVTKPATADRTQYILPTSSTCPAGYAFASGICTLFNSSLVQYPSDNAPTMIAKADGTGFALDSRDPDTSFAPVSIPPVFQSTGVVNGQNTRVTVEPQTGGGLKVTTEQQVMNADGTISTYRQSVTTGANGQVQTSTAANYPGGLAEQTGQTTALAPTAGSPTTLELPTDYNREATQIAIKDEVAAQGETSNLDSNSEAAAASVKQHYDNHVDAAGITGFMAGVGLPSVPSFLLFPTFTAPACHAIGWTFQGRDVSFDICPHVPTIKSIFGWVLNLIAAAMAFQMLMNFRAMRVRG